MQHDVFALADLAKAIKQAARKQNAHCRLKPKLCPREIIGFAVPRRVPTFVQQNVEVRRIGDDQPRHIRVEFVQFFDAIAADDSVHARSLCGKDENVQSARMENIEALL